MHSRLSPAALIGAVRTRSIQGRPTFNPSLVGIGGSVGVALDRRWPAGVLDTQNCQAGARNLGRMSRVPLPKHSFDSFAIWLAALLLLRCCAGRRYYVQSRHPQYM